MYLNFQHLVDSFFYREGSIYARMFNGERFLSTDYQQLHNNVKAISKYIQNILYLEKGNKIGIMSENRPEWMMVYLGIVYNGVIAVPFDVMLSVEEIQNLIKISQIDTMFVSAAVFSNLKKDKEVLMLIKEWIVFDECNLLDTISSKVTFLDNILIQAKEFLLIRHELFPQDIASLIFTSGTTGKPKAVMLTQGNFMHQINNLWIAADLVEQDVVLSVLPLHHTFQFSVEITTLGVGGSITYVESIKPTRLLDAISTTQVTVMIGIPMLYAKIMDGIFRNLNQLSPPIRWVVQILYVLSSIFYFLTHSHKAGEILFKALRKKAGFGSVQFLISGAAPLSYTIAQKYAVLGFNLVNGYGLTEAAPVISVGNRNGLVDNKSVGNAVPKVSWNILDPDQQGVGEICVKGTNVMLGYYNDVKSTNSFITDDGWLKTGDMGYISKKFGQEFLYITGRCKNIIVTSGGKNVYPEEIEEILNEHIYILETLVIGVPLSDYDQSEVVCVLIVLNIEYLESQGIDPHDIEVKKLVDVYVRNINLKLHMHQKIRGYEIRYEELHKNSTRKIKRYEYKGKDFSYLLVQNFKH